MHDGLFFALAVGMRRHTSLCAAPLPTLLLRTSLAFLLLGSACGGGGSGDDSDVDGGSDADEQPACTESTEVFEYDAVVVKTGPGRLRSRTIQHDDLLIHEGKIHVLGSAEQEDGTVQLVLFTDAGQERLTLPARTRSNGELFVHQGEVCALVNQQAAGDNFRMWCPGEEAEAADIDPERPFIPFEHADGTLSVFARTFASYTEVRRSQSGQWSEVEKFESSTSYPRDLVDWDGVPVVCFVDQSDRIVLDTAYRNFSDIRISSTEKATQCVLALSDDTLYVVSELGIATLSRKEVEEAGFGNTPSIEFSEDPIEGTLLGAWLQDGKLRIRVQDRDANIVSDLSWPEMETLASEEYEISDFRFLRHQPGGGIALLYSDFDFDTKVQTLTAQAKCLSVD